MSDCLNSDNVQEAFLAAPPLIAQEILDLSVKHPNWLASLWQAEEWPRGSGTVLEQLIFRGARPQIERGFEKWQKLGNLQGCDPCAPPTCAYNWTNFGGHGFERKIVSLMGRDFKSPEYCISEIQTTAHFREVFAQIVKNLWAQILYFKEFNIGQNFLTAIAKKYVVDSLGPQSNPANIYVYRNIGTARLSNLNIELLEWFYEQMRRMPEAIPYDVVDGAPIFSLMASHQLLARLYRDDAALRQDVRFSGLANDLLMKYNFMSTIRGMFIAAPILYPRRFNIVLGEPVEILPFINDVPGEVGAYTYLNPQYEQATHEEVIIHGKFPFKIFTYPTEGTLGEGTSFGPEDSFMNNWNWINPLTNCDPFRRTGFFATSAKIGLSQQFSDAVFAVLVERPSVRLVSQFNPTPICPPIDPSCNNVVPVAGCPCPVIVGMPVQNPVNLNEWYFTFATDVTGTVGQPVQIALDNGGYITGTLVAISADGKTASITMPASFSAVACAHVIGVYCDNTLGCSATVLCADDCRSNQTDAVKLTLSNPIKADAVGDDIVVCFGDGTTATLDVLAIDMANNLWTVRYAPGFGPTDNPTGALAPGSVSAYAEFFALMPPDNAATVPVGGDVDFPQDGPTSGTIIRTGADTFLLPNIGTYRVLFTVSVSEPGQLVLTLGGVQLPYTLSGRATGTSLITGEALVTTTVVNSILTLRNPAGNAAALTITPIAGGTNAVAATLLIEQIDPASGSGFTALSADMICDRQGILRVCVPPTTDVTCPACDLPTVVPCEEVIT